MDEALKILTLFGGVFALLTLMANFLMRTFPRIPGDFNIDKPGFTIYVPFTSSIVLTVLITVLFKYFFG
jgi:hypothetical protein